MIIGFARIARYSTRVLFLALNTATIISIFLMISICFVVGKALLAI